MSESSIMSGSSVAAAAIIDQRLARDGVTVDADERDRLIGLVSVAQGWVQRISGPEIRYAEPGITHRVE